MESKLPASPGFPVPKAEKPNLRRANLERANLKRASLKRPSLKRPSLLLFMALLVGVATAPARADMSPMGEWFTEDRGGVIRIEPCADALCGYIVGLTPPMDARPQVDVHGRPQCHLLLLASLRPREDGRWHGTVTNPEDGRTYKAEVWVPNDGMLRLHGYIGLPIFGETQRWPAFHGTLRADCRFR